jgi:L-threonylcarbamoyladenylate synthase
VSTDVAHAAEMLRHGGLVAFPTETVYGLGADARNATAVKRMYAVKGRPTDHPVIVHVARPEQLDDIACDISDAARELAHANWPGPLTLIVRRRAGAVVDEVTGGRDTVGVRVPNHPLALELLEAFNGPVAAPSANRFGRVSPTTAEHVRADLNGDVDLILDGGPCAVGVESTIIDVTGAEPRVVRLGGAPFKGLERANNVVAPGTLASHYAPNARVEIVDAGEVSARLAKLRADGANADVLDAPNDPVEYARVLYQLLRAADDAQLEVVLAVLPEDDGAMGSVVRDRLLRAANR